MEENIKLSIIKNKNICNLINFDNLKNENLVIYKKPEFITFNEIINKITLQNSKNYFYINFNFNMYLFLFLLIYKYT